MSAIGGIIGGAMQASAAKKAAEAQKQAADDQLALQREVFDYTKGIQAPFLGRGNTAGDILAYEMWGGAAPTIGASGYEVGGTTYGTMDEAEAALAAANARFNGAFNRPGGGGDVAYIGGWNQNDADREGGMPVSPAGWGGWNGGTGGYGGGSEADAIAAAGFDPRSATINTVGGEAYGGFRKTPDYNFVFNEGVNAVDASAAAKGGLKSGATLKALTEYGQKYAGTRRDNYLNNLFRMSGQGQGAANALQAGGQNFATGAGTALANYGNAASAGHIGAGNAMASGITTGLQGIGSIAKQIGKGGSIGDILLGAL